jgi:uncharacterized damage-inducible protein DinB
VVQGFTNGLNEDENGTCVFEVHGKPSQGQVFGMMPSYRFAQLASMRKLLSPVIAVALLAFAAGPTCAQQTAKNSKPPVPAEGLAQEVLEAWNGIGDKLIEMAQNFPEEKYDFTPTPDVRPFAEVLIHLVGTSYIFTDAAQGKPLRPHDLKRKDYPTKASIVAAVKVAYQEGTGVIKAKGDKGMSQIVYQDFGNQMVHVYDLGYSSAMHASEHYGQLVVYFRLNGIVPPETRKNTQQQQRND